MELTLLDIFDALLWIGAIGALVLWFDHRGARHAREDYLEYHRQATGRMAGRATGWAPRANRKR